MKDNAYKLINHLIIGDIMDTGKIWNKWNWLSALRGNKLFRGIWRAVWTGAIGALITYGANSLGIAEVQILEVVGLIAASSGLEKYWRVFIKEK